MLAQLLGYDRSETSLTSTVALVVTMSWQILKFSKIGFTNEENSSEPHYEIIPELGLWFVLYCLWRVILSSFEFCHSQRA